MSTVKYSLSVLFVLASLVMQAQYAFELNIDYAMRVGNTDQFSISGELVKGRLEDGKSYFADGGGEFKVTKIISSKTATTVPVASAGEAVSFSAISKNWEPMRGDALKAVTTRPTYTGNGVRYSADKLQEGQLSCKVNGRPYTAFTVTKPVRMRNADMLDLFFEAEDKSVIWIQLNRIQDMKEIPIQTKSDTSNKDRMYVCKFAYMPEGYRPTDLPNNYRAYEDMKGNSGVRVVFLNMYEKKIAFEFNGILRPNSKILEEKPNAGLFYISEGRVDNISWDDF